MCYLLTRPFPPPGPQLLSVSFLGGFTPPPPNSPSCSLHLPHRTQNEPPSQSNEMDLSVSELSLCPLISAPSNAHLALPSNPHADLNPPSHVVRISGKEPTRKFCPCHHSIQGHRTAMAPLPLLTTPSLSFHPVPLLLLAEPELQTSFWLGPLKSDWISTRHFPLLPLPSPPHPH